MVYHNAMGDQGQERHHFTRCLGIWRLGDVPGCVKSLRSVAKVFFLKMDTTDALHVGM
jgi:hypothetical protein